MLRFLATFLIISATTGCFRGKLDFRFSDCKSGEERRKSGICNAATDQTTPTDSTVPTVVLTTAASLTNANPIIFTANFSRPVQDFSIIAVTVSNGTITNISGDGAQYALAITPTQDGEVSVALNAGAAKSLTGIASAASNTVTTTYDGTAPTLSFVSLDRTTLEMSSSAADPTLTLTLSEAAAVTLYNDNTCAVSIAEPQNLQGISSQTIKADGLERASKTRIHGRAVDAAGNASACTNLVTYTHILKFIDPRPAVSNGFGSHIVELKNGNIVISSPQATVNGVSQAGAVYLYNGETGALISTLYGSTTNDQVGSAGVTALTNGNFVVATTNWDCSLALGCSGTVVDAGAATFVNGTTGIDGPVNAGNSAVGSTAGDQVGLVAAIALTNGNYVLRSNWWDCTVALGCSGTILQAGAVTFGNGTIGTVGPVSASNSLVGSTDLDYMGGAGVYPLTNGNYVVATHTWDCTGLPECSLTSTDVGAVTFGNGVIGTVGPATAANSLMGSTSSDEVGGSRVFPLANGNYVVSSFVWDCRVDRGCSGAVANVGAATFGNGTTGTVGAVDISNSLIGATANDSVSVPGIVGRYASVVALTDGNYVVASPSWDCQTTAPANCASAIIDAGAITLGNGTTGTVGHISASNSIVGTSAYDSLGSAGITALSNGNYVFASHLWNCNVAKGCAGVVGTIGAVTFRNGTTPTSSAFSVSSSNSLIGYTGNDQVGGGGVIALTNGNYVVVSNLWDCQTARGCASAAINAGAVTLGNGSSGTSGFVDASNSLVGSLLEDQLGNHGLAGVPGVKALSNGNYVVISSYWNCQTALGCPSDVSDVGAITWGNGVTGVVGPVSASNSLVGSTASDVLGSMARVDALTNGNYIVRSAGWDCQTNLGCASSVVNVGAATWGSGTSGITGPVTTSNSLVASMFNDFFGEMAATATTDGRLIFTTRFWGTWDFPLVIKVPGTDGPAGQLFE